jgi:hypothetical protein
MQDPNDNKEPRYCCEREVDVSNKQPTIIETIEFIPSFIVWKVKRVIRTIIVMRKNAKRKQSRLNYQAIKNGRSNKGGFIGISGGCHASIIASVVAQAAQVASEVATTVQKQRERENNGS